MALLGFEKDTLLDLVVNIIPLGILVFFIAAFALVNPFGFDPVFSGLQFSLMVSMLLLLAVLTYYAGKAIEAAEKGNEAPVVHEPADETDSEDVEPADDDAAEA